MRLDIATNDAETALSGDGVEQAKALGRWLGRIPPCERPTVAIVSPYLRARDTARLVLAEAGLSGLSLRYDERIRDREQGVLDRLTSAGFSEQYPQEAERRHYVGKFWYRPTGGESWADVVLRVRAALLDWRLSLPRERILAVCHDMPILAFRYVLEELTPEDAVAMSGTVQNCSVTRYELDDDHLALRAFSETTALEQSPSAPVTAHD